MNRSKRLECHSGLHEINFRLEFHGAGSCCGDDDETLRVDRIQCHPPTLLRAMAPNTVVINVNFV